MCETSHDNVDFATSLGETVTDLLSKHFLLCSTREFIHVPFPAAGAVLGPQGFVFDMLVPCGSLAEICFSMNDDVL